MFKITFSRVSRETETLHSVYVYVDGIMVAEMQKDPTAEMPTWYTHESDVAINDTHRVHIPDCDWDSRLADAKRWIAADIRGYLQGQA